MRVCVSSVRWRERCVSVYCCMYNVCVREREDFEEEKRWMGDGEGEGGECSVTFDNATEHPIDIQ